MQDDVLFREYAYGDEHEILKLYGEVFKEELSLEVWKWKYVDHGLGTMAAIAEEKATKKIVGHYGLMPRRVHFKGVSHLSAVVSDVMIHPSKRGAFTRHGLFYHLVKFAIDRFTPVVGKRRIIMGYGFPMERAKNIGLKLGLYEEVEDAVEVWLARGKNPFPYSAKLCQLREEFVSVLWDSMKKSMHSFVVNCRDYATLRWRYSQPKARFSFYCVYRFFSLVSLIVVREDLSDKKLYDYIGDISHIDKSINAFLDKYKDKVKVRFPPWIVESLKNVKIVDGAGKITLVTNALSGPSSHELKSKFFYTYGDEDV